MRTKKKKWTEKQLRKAVEKYTRSDSEARNYESDLVDARGMKGSEGGGGGWADEEGGHGEGFQGHEVGMTGVAFSVRGYAPSQLTHTCRSPPQVGPNLGTTSFSYSFVLLFLQLRHRLIHVGSVFGFTVLLHLRLCLLDRPLLHGAKMGFDILSPLRFGLLIVVMFSSCRFLFSGVAVAFPSLSFCCLWFFQKDVVSSVINLSFNGWFRFSDQPLLCALNSPWQTPWRGREYATWPQDPIQK